MKTDVKIFNKLLTNQIQEHIKRIIHHNQEGFILGCKDSSTYANKSAISHISRMKEKNPIIISTDADKTSDKIQYPFLIKTLNKLDTEGA